MGRWICLYGISSGIELQTIIITDMVKTSAQPKPRPKIVAQRHAPFPQNGNACDPPALKETAMDAIATELTGIYVDGPTPSDEWLASPLPKHVPACDRSGGDRATNEASGHAAAYSQLPSDGIDRDKKQADRDQDAHHDPLWV